MCYRVFVKYSAIILKIKTMPTAELGAYCVSFVQLHELEVVDPVFKAIDAPSVPPIDAWRQWLLFKSIDKLFIR